MSEAESKTVQDAYTQQEAKDGRVGLLCEDPGALYAMATAVSGYPELNNAEEDAPFHLRVHNFADKYNVPRLVSIAAKRFMQLAKDHRGKAIFGTYLTAVLEDNAAASVLRAETFDVVLANVYDITRAGTKASYQYADIATIKAALIRAPDFTVEILTKAAEASRPASLALTRLEEETATTSTSETYQGKPIVEKRARCHITRCGRLYL
nr:hypothetical protein B0A51_11516 [Rachicladosporium sp. CCFEE 5018]